MTAKRENQRPVDGLLMVTTLATGGRTPFVAQAPAPD
jgi:hypothetical protein